MGEKLDKLKRDYMQMGYLDRRLFFGAVASLGGLAGKYVRPQIFGTLLARGIYLLCVVGMLVPVAVRSYREGRDKPRPPRIRRIEEIVAISLWLFIFIFASI